MKIAPVIAVSLACSLLPVPCLVAAEKTTAIPASAAKAELWTTDFAAAKEKALKEGKDILLDFTGSDWCGWCIKLKKEVFGTPEFEAAAPKRFVLVEIDFPRDKGKMTPKVAAQNEKLQDNFGVEGFPTIILLDAQGRPYGKTGYADGGPAKYLESLAELQKVRETRDAAWKKAGDTQGVAKAKLLAEGLLALDEDFVMMHYGPVLAEIKKLDPQDASGIVKKSEYRTKLAGLAKASGETFEKTRDSSAAAQLVDDFIKVNAVTGEELQKVMMLKLNFYPPRTLDGVNKALALLDDVIKIAPGSETGKQASEIKPRAETFKKRLEEKDSTKKK